LALSPAKNIEEEGLEEIKAAEKPFSSENLEGGVSNFAVVQQPKIDIPQSLLSRRRRGE
jgi:hypothetical protein